MHVDRAAHLRSNDGELERFLTDPESLIIPVWRNKSLLAKGRPSRPALVRRGDAQGLLEGSGAIVWLGLCDGTPVFAVDVDPGEATVDLLSHIGEFSDLRMIGSLLQRAEAELLAYARGMLHWHRHSRFCPRCGDVTLSGEGGHVRTCGKCERKHFPRTDPAVMALVIHGNRCLLARQPAFPDGMYSVLAGFVEPGETLEQAVTREVLEEVGLDVERLVYLRSQPWPFPASLMLGFVAHAKDDTIRIDDDELEDARWFSREQIRSPEDIFIPPPYSLANQMISVFLDENLPT